jgi:phenylalanyl-tRNA synthetase beta chain
MLIPISWLKEFTPVTLKLPKLMWKMTEIGITTESYKRINGEVVLDIEVTPNRPDLLSLIGVAREVSVIENKKLKLPKIPEIKKSSKNLPIEVNISKNLTGRYSGITVANVAVKPSPKVIQDRLKLMGLRPINNLVDITNYVMFEMGIPIHAFDYDKFKATKLSVELAKGGEEFISVDDISYKLPKNALIIKDIDRVIDLAGIKGGKNTGISSDTKNIFIHVPIYDPLLVRKNSQNMKLSSDASYIYERGPDLGGTMDALRRTLDLVLKYAGGEIASEVIDHKSKDYTPRDLSLSFSKLQSILGLKLTSSQTGNILEKLNLSPNISKDTIMCKVPTYRNDIQIEEDLIEEVARVYGYNKFPTTLPQGSVTSENIPYHYDRSFEIFLKNYMQGAGYYETNTLALTSEENIKKSGLNLDNHIKIANPVSLEYEYMRTSLIPRLLEAIKLNADESKVKLFEFNNVYFGPLDESQEPHILSAVVKGNSYTEIKGVVDTLLAKLNIGPLNLKPTAVKKGLWHPKRSGVLEVSGDILGTVGELSPIVLQSYDIKQNLFAFELDVSTLLRHLKLTEFTVPPKYPAQIEDLTLTVPNGLEIGKLITYIKSKDKLISSVELVDSYQDSYTFRVWFQNPKKTMTDSEVGKIRDKLLKGLKSKHGVILKD